MLNIVTFGWRGWPLRCRKIWWFTVTINEPAIWLRWFYLLKALAFADSAGLRKYTNLFFIIVVTSLTGYRKKQCVIFWFFCLAVGEGGCFRLCSCHPCFMSLLADFSICCPLSQLIPDLLLDFSSEKQIMVYYDWLVNQLLRLGFSWWPKSDVSHGIYIWKLILQLYVEFNV